MNKMQILPDKDDNDNARAEAKVISPSSTRVTRIDREFIITIDYLRFKWTFFRGRVGVC